MFGGDVQRQIANAHTLFNVTNVFIQVWFIGFLVKIVNPTFLKNSDFLSKNGVF